MIKNFKEIIFLFTLNTTAGKRVELTFSVKKKLNKYIAYKKKTI